MALRPDGSGNVTESHVAWAVQEYLPDISSPVSDGEVVLTVTSSGLMACFEAQGGKKLWEHDYEMEVQASPVIASGRVYVVSTQGDVAVAAVGQAFTEVSRSKLDDDFYASPAFADGKIILRGKKQLWCFGGRK